MRQEEERRGLPTTGNKGVLLDRLLQSHDVPVHVNGSQDTASLSIKRAGPTLARIPFGSRPVVAEQIVKVIQDVVSKNDLQSWQKLLSFGEACLGQPKKSKDNMKQSLTSLVKSQVKDFADGSFKPSNTVCAGKKRHLSALVGAKLAAFDVKGAVRLVSSEDKFMVHSKESLDRLREKHPPPHPNTSMPDGPDDHVAFLVDKEDIKRAIRSFRPGTSAGLDGLSPQHLKDLTADGFALGNKVLSCLCDFYNRVVLPGRVPSFVLETFYGAVLFGLEKPNNGCRPIAIGLTLRRLAGKIAMCKLQDVCSSLLRPHQLGVGVRRGCEAAVHAVRRFVSSPSSGGKVLLKIDMSNAFNSIRRDSILRLVKEHVPLLYPMTWQAYSRPSRLSFGNDEIASEEGVQQGDALGPFYFSLGIMDLIKGCDSELNIWYLDDGTIAGDIETVLSDLKHIIDAASALGLKINSSKCELSLIGPHADPEVVLQSFRSLAPDIIMTPLDNLSLLGAPILPPALADSLSKKLQDLKRMVLNLNSLDSHDGYFLLKNCFAIPKLTYLLRASPCFLRPDILSRYDVIIRDALESILNVQLLDRSWEQACLPVGLGGIGVRRASDLACPAFLSSAHGTEMLVNTVLSESVSAEGYSFVGLATEGWKSVFDQEVPLPAEKSIQAAWDHPVCDFKLKHLIESSPSLEQKAILLSVSSENSSDWLHSIPVPSLGLKLDNTSLKIAISLRLSCKVCQEHTCICGAPVNAFGRHGLSCKKARGRHPRHSGANRIIQKALGSADFPSTLEPSGLSRIDGKRPDGLTFLPYQDGKNLIWDFTCCDTVAPSNLSLSIEGPGKAAEKAETRKWDHYAELSGTYHFVPIAAETFGAWAPSSLKFVKDLGRRIRTVSGQHNSAFFLFQSLGMQIQRGNAASIMGALDSSEQLEEVFYL